MRNAIKNTEMKKQKFLIDYYIFKWKGAVFDKVESSGDRIAGYSIQAETLEELKEKHKIINENIKVIDENGNDIMRHDLITEIK